MNKHFALAFVLVLVLSSLVMVKPECASAQPTVTPDSTSPTPTPTYPKPSVPEFTAKLVSPQPEANETRIELTIKNQPFDSNNTNHYSLVYNVRISTDGENWTDLYNAEDGYPPQSNADYTVLSYVLGESAYYPPADYPLAPSMKVGILPTAGQVAFQVEAMIGYRDRGAYVNGTMPYVFKGEKSGWSSTQTITIGANSSFSWAEISVFAALIAIAALLVAIALVRRRQTKNGR